jgi:hypothetical protein
VASVPSNNCLQHGQSCECIADGPVCRAERVEVVRCADPSLIWRA